MDSVYRCEIVNQSINETDREFARRLELIVADLQKTDKLAGLPFVMPIGTNSIGNVSVMIHWYVDTERSIIEITEAQGQIIAKYLTENREEILRPHVSGLDARYAGYYANGYDLCVQTLLDMFPLKTIKVDK